MILETLDASQIEQHVLVRSYKSVTVASSDLHGTASAEKPSSSSFSSSLLLNLVYFFIFFILRFRKIVADIQPIIGLNGDGKVTTKSIMAYSLTISLLKIVRVLSMNDYA